MTVCTTERRRFSADLPQGGLEIPCLVTFEGAGKDIQGGSEKEPCRKSRRSHSARTRTYGVPFVSKLVDLLIFIY